MSEQLFAFYPWLRALHILSVIAWMAGMLYLPRLFVYHMKATAGGELDETLKVQERRLLRGITNPAMIAAWVFGLLMLWANPGLATLVGQPEPELAGRHVEELVHPARLPITSTTTDTHSARINLLRSAGAIFDDSVRRPAKAAWIHMGRSLTLAGEAAGLVAQGAGFPVHQRAHGRSTAQGQHGQDAPARFPDGTHEKSRSRYQAVQTG